MGVSLKPTFSLPSAAPGGINIQQALYSTDLTSAPRDNRDETGEAGEMNLEVDSKDEVMHIEIEQYMYVFNEKTVVEKRR